VQNYVLKTCVAEKLEHEEKYDGRKFFWFCTIYLNFFFRDKVLLMKGPSVLDPIDCN
jgi:predicted GNAT superfamily acetyltransferase